MRTLIVFSHLRWDFVYQRPQHLLSRLSKHYRILFFEEPVHSACDPHFVRSQPLANLTVLTPVTPATQPHFSDEQMPYLLQLVYQLRAEEPDPIVWFYTPMALPLLEEHPPTCRVRLHGRAERLQERAPAAVGA
ncbi:MAG TPA: hypothetical protein VFF81_11725 [Noviherbaspirillum sp.]|nr:hypothetical protein [Noviherbaspirillum sp.]